MEPIIDPEGHITHWRCGSCAWIRPVAREFWHVRVAPAIIRMAFDEHQCENYVKREHPAAA
jgi:hypothetical protein